MFLRWLNHLRCELAHAVMRGGWKKGIGLARRIAPSTTSLIRHRPRRPPPLVLPPRSHLIYHQSTVDLLAAENSIATLAAQIPAEDEVVLLDVGGSANPSLLDPFRHCDWTTYSSCRAMQPEQRSYTFGLNAAMATLKAPLLFVWRTDYVYPPDLIQRYRRSLEHAWFAAPYDVLVGTPETDARFVRAERSRLDPFDESYWSERSKRLSLYETQDPALFAIRWDLWKKIGGLNHQLWGYGWQFAEFAVRVRTTCPSSRIDYFSGPPPLHQTHEGSQMHQPGDRQMEAEAGRKRFVGFLGAESAYQMYRMKQTLPPKRDR